MMDMDTPWSHTPASALVLPKGLKHLSSRLLALDDAPAVLALRRQILTTMRPQLRLMDAPEFSAPPVEAAWAQAHLGPRARTLGVFDAQALVGFASVVLPLPTGKDELSMRLELTPADVARSAHMAACMLAEDYRGLHLQTKLLNWRRESALAAHRSLLLAMTACGNTYSRRNLLAAGLGVRWVGELRPASWWYVLAHDLNQEHDLSGAVEWVDVANVPRQVALCEKGWVGVSEFVRPDHGRAGTSKLQFVGPKGHTQIPLPQAPGENGA